MKPSVSEEYYGSIINIDFLYHYSKNENVLSPIYTQDNTKQKSEIRVKDNNKIVWDKAN